MNKILLIFCLFWSYTIHAQGGMDKLDFKILQKTEASRNATQTRTLKIISDANNYVNMAIPAGLFVAGAIDHNKNMRQNALYVVSSTATTALLNFALKRIIKRPRPFLVHLSLTPVYKPGEYSMPSGHTSASFSTATALSRAYPKWYVAAPAFLWAGTVGYSRVYLGVHNPSDVVAGAALGVGTAFGFNFMKQ